MIEGPRWARIHNLERGCITGCCRCSSARRRRRRDWSAEQGRDDTVQPVVAAGSVSCVELLDRRVDCAMVVAAARASAEPVPLLGGYGKNRSENDVSGSRARCAVGTVFGSGDGGRNASDECPRGGRKSVNSYTWFVCEKLVKYGRREREPTQAACSVRGTKPPKAVLSVRGTIPTKAGLSVRGTSPSKAVF